MNHLIVFPVAIYLGAAFLLPLLCGKNDVLAGISGIAFTFLSLAVSALLGISVFTGGRIIYFVGGWTEPLGIMLMLDPLSCLFLLLTNTVAFIIMLYSAVYIKKYHRAVYFYVLFMLMLAGMNGILISMDFFNLFVFFEIASIASFIIVAFGLRAEELEASLKYTVISFIASSLILFAIAMIYGLTGTLNIPAFMHAAAHLPQTHLWFTAGLLLAGFAVKAGLAPFHAWLPDAHSMAPAPVSALLSGLFIKIVGFYAIIRLTSNIFTDIPQIRTILLVFGIVSMLLGSFAAYGQNNIKRMFAYSTISQIGYCAIGLGIGGYLGNLGVLMHIIAHAFSKSLLFLNIGAVEYMTGTTDSDKLRGLNDSMPYTTLLSSAGMLGIAGIPPMGNFWSKVIIIIAAVHAGYGGIAALCIIAAVMTLGYFLKLQRTVYCSKKEGAVKKEAPAGLIAPMAVLAFMAVFAGILLIPGIREPFIDKAVDVMDNFSYINIAIGD
ncbi:MAG: NADH/ubiquinone/plastoquinone (complex I) [Candidatus Omnitrophica bacterium]|nr:NADH/ubiquinone/plastoquinone (complex I) [Candidatus Omnitrophota bacterium]